MREMEMVDGREREKERWGGQVEVKKRGRERRRGGVVVGGLLCGRERGGGKTQHNQTRRKL